MKATEPPPMRRAGSDRRALRDDEARALALSDQMLAAPLSR